MTLASRYCSRLNRTIHPNLLTGARLPTTLGTRPVEDVSGAELQPKVMRLRAPTAVLLLEQLGTLAFTTCRSRFEVTRWSAGSDWVSGPTLCLEPRGECNVGLNS